jgi:hypothetical protein
MSDPITQTITIAAIEPAVPLVLCEPKFLQTIATVEREVASLNVVDAVSAQSAANLQQRLTTAGRMLETARTTLKAPFIAKGREIDEAAKAPAKRIEDLKAALSKRLTDYAAEQARIAAEEEKKRQAELRRLELLRLAEEKAEREKAEKAARDLAEAQAKAAVPVEAFDFDGPAPEAEPVKSETELKIEAVKFAAPVVAPAPVGVAFKSRLIVRVVDVKALPDLYVIRTANETAIRTQFCNGWKEGDPLPELPGCEFTVQKTAVSTGRAVF